MGKHEEEELEFRSKANRMLSIDCLPEFNFLEDESSFKRHSPSRQMEDLDFDLSSIQGERERESQLTIFWLDNPDYGINSPLHLDDKTGRKSSGLPPKTSFRRASKLETPKQRDAKGMLAITVTMSDNKEDWIEREFKLEGSDGEKPDPRLLSVKGREKNRNPYDMRKILSTREGRVADYERESSEKSSDSRSPAREVNAFVEKKSSGFEKLEKKGKTGETTPSKSSKTDFFG